MRKRYICTLLTLSGSIFAFAQPEAKFETLNKQIKTLLWNTPGTATFEVRNTGDQPLIIKSVRSSCGCIVADWTKNEIKSGETGLINATIEARMLGHFDKELQVFTNADEKPVYLKMSGEVVKEITAYQGEYKFKVGDIHFSSDEIVFDDVNKGDMPQQTISLINNGKKTYRPTLMHLPKYIKVLSTPEDVRPGKTGKITFILDSKQLTSMGLTKTSVYVSRYPGDRVSTEREITISAVLLPAFFNYSDNKNAAQPSLTLSNDSINLDLSEGKSKAKETLILTNSGSAPLEIRALQVFNSAINVKLNKQTIKAGESAKLQVSIVAKYLSKAKGRLRVMLITNDPDKAKIFIDIKLKK